MSLPPIKLQSLSASDQVQLPFTLGHNFKAGDLMPTDGLKAGTTALQVDVKATHADGSVRHAVLSGVYPKLKAGETASLPLVKAKPLGGAVVDLSSIAGTDAKVTLTIGGEPYSASLAGAEIASITAWLAGLAVVEGFVNAPMKNTQGVEHPLLQVRFGVRYYPAIKQARIEFIVENAKTFVTNSNVVYDVKLEVAGKTVYSKEGLTHYRRSRWHKYSWTGTAPAVNIQLDTAYLISTRAVPNYDMRNVPWDGLLDEVAKKIGEGNTGPMTIGPITNYMPMTGGREDIGSLPSWAVQWLLSMDKRPRDVMMAAADGSGTWSIHLRDENTGYPVRTDNPKNSTISTHGNISNIGPLAVPRESGDVSTPFAHDTAHEPSLAYLPYMVTGDYYYLEELQFWAASNPLETAPENHAGKGLVRWQQERGQAWSMRTLGHAAYITPDEHPLKAYFLAQLDANLDFYNTMFVVNNPNELGVYDGSGELAFRNDHNDISPWQDDFFTWAIGYLGDLGFSKALPVVQWKAKYPVGRMMDTESCWIAAADYNRPLRGPDGQVFKTLGEQYRATYGGPTLTFDNVQPAPSAKNGISFIDLPCMSQSQADFLTTYTGWTWDRNRMFGYSDFEMGYPANMQPALAAAVNIGYPQAQDAWERFESRTNKPDYRKAPQWAILPWSVPNLMPVPAAPSTPAAPAAPIVVTPVDTGLALGSKPADNIAGTWTKAADENGIVKVATKTFVRYGAVGKGYLYAQAIRDFQANNSAMGGDPAPGIVKVVEVFTPDPPKAAGKIKTGSNKLLAKLKGLQVAVMPEANLGTVVKSFSGVTALSTGSLSLVDVALTPGVVYVLQVKSDKGQILDIIWPAVATK